MAEDTGLFDLFGIQGQPQATEPIDSPAPDEDGGEGGENAAPLNDEDGQQQPVEVEENDPDTTPTDPNEDDDEGDEGEVQDSDSSIFEAIANEMGLEEYNFEGYTEDYGGVAKFVNDYANSHIGNFLQTLESEAPELFELIKAADAGEDYYSMMKEFVSLTPDNWYELELSTETPESTLRALISDELKERGMSKDDIADFIHIKEQNGTLLTTAQNFHSEALQNMEKMREKTLEQRRQQEQQYNQNIQQNVQQIQEQLASRKIGNFTIPQNEINDFANFLDQSVQPDDNGNLYIPMVANNNQALAAAYLLFKQGDISDVVEKAARTKNANQLKQRLSAAQKEKGSKASANKKQTPQSRNNINPDFGMYNDLFN